MKLANPRFWASDWFSGLVISLLFLVIANSAILEGVERGAYDLGMKLATRAPSDRVAVIAIDDQSIENMGRWPWPRSVHAQMIDKLAGGNAKLIGYSVFFLEPQLDPGLQHIQSLISFYNKSSLSNRVAAKSLQRDLKGLGQRLKRAARELDNDTTLARSISRAKNVVLSMPFSLGVPLGRPEAGLPDYISKQAATDISGSPEFDGEPIPTNGAFPPVQKLGAAALAVGHLNQFLDVDGSVRTEPLLLNHYGAYIPSLSLQLAARSLNLNPGDIRVQLGRGISLGNLQISTDAELQLYPFFYDEMGSKPPFNVDSFYDVMSGKIPAAKYRDKIVLIGATATGVGNPQVTPISPSMAPVLTLAHSLSSLLNEQFIITPEWGPMVEWSAFLLIALYLVSLLPRMKAGVAAITTLILLNVLVDSHFFLFAKHGIWVQLMTPALMLLLGHLLLTTKRFLATERGKLRSDIESVESNKMLAMAFQNQGQLDMAYEKLRRCPLDESVMELLYNLALDFERKRQFNKASNIYERIADHDRSYKDVQKRLDRANNMDGTVMLGSTSPNALSTALISGDGVEKPMLGRYQVERELGKGAMGIVYLGRDPKINRVVAIKTMALSQEFEDDELVEVKERFFREAETAGRLNHPNIVTIYDAGEEHDLAYIAMEFLKGHDLMRYTKRDKLLPVPTVFNIVFKAAAALDYAHGNNVVHRDVKPANIMYDPEAEELKLTDFGIARITDSSKTKTGTVLGTPSYMSPEQLAGHRIDGRSDLYSLGVLFYQMLCGHLPFEADSMASLMFKITNEPHPPIRTYRGDLPPCISKLIDKAMQKTPEARYQSGADFAKDLKLCARQISMSSKQKSGG